jgi:UDP-glucose 4-epimerase
MNNSQRIDRLHGARSIAVTGGAGLIGRALVSHLLTSTEWRVTVIDPFADEHMWKQTDRLTVVRELVSNVEAVQRAIAHHDGVVHLAASTRMTPDRDRRRRDIHAGLEPTAVVLDAMRRAGVRNLLFTSSSAVYGDLAYCACTENAGPLLPKSTYGAGKLAAEGWISAASQLDGLDSTILRLGTVVGRGIDRGLIKDVVTGLREHPKTLTVRGDGNQERTYISPGSLAKAMITIWRTGPHEGCDVYNVSGLGTISTREVVLRAASRLGLAAPRIVPGNGPRGWPGDVPVVKLALKKASALGWKPPRSEAAVDEAIAWLARLSLEELKRLRPLSR